MNNSLKLKAFSPFYFRQDLTMYSRCFWTPSLALRFPKVAMSGVSHHIQFSRLFTHFFLVLSPIKSGLEWVNTCKTLRILSGLHLEQYVLAIIIIIKFELTVYKTLLFIFLFEQFILQSEEYFKLSTAIIRQCHCLSSNLGIFLPLKKL